MKRRWKGILVVGLVIGAMSLGGCLFNVFQTARTIGAGNVGLTVGSGLFNLGGDADGGWILSPQARLTIGMADGVDFGIYEKKGLAYPAILIDPARLRATDGVSLVDIVTARFREDATRGRLAELIGTRLGVDWVSVFTTFGSSA